MRVCLFLLLAAVLSCGLTASSRADGPRALMLVGRGASGGVQWAQRARANGTHVITELTLRGADNVPGSSFSDAWLAARDPVDWTVERDVGPDDLELLDGTAYRTVDHFRLEFADGTTRRITPYPAPRGARGKWPALAHYRFFILFLPPQPAMMRLVAVGSAGQVVERIPLPAPSTLS